MPKFRKKPIVIEAERWFPGKEIIGVEIRGEFIDGPDEWVKTAYIDTLEGTMRVRPGDWVITGVNGEKYPCESDIFDKTYDSVEAHDVDQFFEEPKCPCGGSKRFCLICKEEKCSMRHEHFGGIVKP